MAIKFTKFFLFSVTAVLLLYINTGLAGEVVVYTSVDQIYSEPVLKGFEKKTGIKVLALYDVEASKTVGMVNRLIAEKNLPKADVFWNSEVIRTILLKKKGILIPYRSSQWDSFPNMFKDKDYYWTGFAARARVIIWNTELLTEADLPESIFQLTNLKWKKKFAMAYPLFGTTSMHVAALYSVLGPDKAEAYLKGLVKNQVIVVNGNSVVRDLVVQGKVPMGLTDTDDVNVAILKKRPVRMYFPDQNGIGTLLIPNTVALIKNGPNLENGKLMVDYLLSKKTESFLAFGKSAQMPLRSGVKKPDFIPDVSEIKTMNINYNQIAGYINKASVFCQKLFTR